MEINLRSVKISLALSEETIAFVADVFVNGKKTAYARNDGHGGSTNVQAYPGMIDTLRAADEYCKALPPVITDGFSLDMDLEFFVDNLIDAEVAKLEAAKFVKKLNTKAKTHTVILNKDHLEKVLKGELHSLDVRYIKLPSTTMTDDQIRIFLLGFK